MPSAKHNVGSLAYSHVKPGCRRRTSCFGPSHAKHTRAALLLCCLTVSGCVNGPQREPADLTMAQAIGVLNSNNEAVSERPWRLSGAGRWSGQIVDDEGRKRTVHNKTFKLSAVHPQRVSFKAAHKPETNTAFEIGSNQDVMWLWLQWQDDELHIARRDSAGKNDSGLLIEPDALIEALGIQLIKPDTTGPAGPRYRVDGDHHQLLFEGELPDGQMVIVKEYWLSRFEPFLLERIIYRDTNGRVLVSAQLSNYQPLDNNSALTPRQIDIHWPPKEWSLSLRFDRLKRYPDLEHPSFLQPAERARRDPRLSPPARIIWRDES